MTERDAAQDLRSRGQDAREISLNLRDSFIQLRTEFSEFRQNTQVQLNYISDNMQVLVNDKHQRAGEDKVKKSFLAVGLLLIPAAVSAAITWIMHK